MDFFLNDINALVEPDGTFKQMLVDYYVSGESKPISNLASRE